MKTAEEAACTEQGFLSDILGIGPPAQQPTRKVESSVDMGQHKLLKAHSVFESQLTHNSLLNSETS
jgi:hypothetical protein